MEDILIAVGTFYANVDPRRKQELADSRMVQEDHSAMANCSPHAVYREFNPDKYVAHLAMYNQSAKKYRS